MKKMTRPGFKELACMGGSARSKNRSQLNFISKEYIPIPQVLLKKFRFCAGTLIVVRPVDGRRFDILAMEL